MKKILYVNSCVRPQSRTNRLAEKLLNLLNGDVTEVHTDDCGTAPLTNSALNKRELLISESNFSVPEFENARLFAEADIIVISAPYWDMSFPSSLKVYFENINVRGITFCYTDEGIPKGLCRAKELYYVTTAGGKILNNFGFEYVDALSKVFYGIKNTHFVCAEGLDIIGADTEKILMEAEKRINL